MRLPTGPTLLVAAAVPAMVALGFWQLDRREEKAALLARVAAEERQPDLPEVDLRARPWPEGLGRRRAILRCAFDRRSPPDERAGRDRSGRVGYSYFLSCPKTYEHGAIEVNAGWSPRPNVALPGLDRPIDVRGILLPLPPEQLRDMLDGAPYRMIADPALPPLKPSGLPVRADIPNNHLSYAVQWFSFAAMLAVIWALYVRRWRRGRG